MKSKKELFLVIGFVLIILGYFVIKGFFFYAYNTSKLVENNYSFVEEIKEAFENKNTITIKHSGVLEDDYLQFEGFKIRNDFEIYNEHKRIYKFKDSDILVGFSKNPIDSLVSVVKEESKNVGLFYDLTKDLEKNNIDTDYKLYEYLLENVNQELNLFTSIHNLRKAQAINLSTMIISNSVNEVILIDGDYEGYVLKNNSSKSVFLEHNGDCYSIIIYSNAYSDEDLYKLLSAIQFD